MNIRFAASMLLCCALSTPALAQDNTLLFQDFENGLPADWTAGAPWRLVQNGECGALSRMMSFGSGAPTCDYVGAVGQNETLLLPAITAPAGLNPWQIAFDYVLDVDATGDEVGLVVSNASSQLIFFTETARFVNDGALHSIVLPITAQSAPFPTVVGIFVAADGIGDSGRGLAVDNVRVSNTLTGMIFCDGAAPASCPCGNGGGAFRGCANSNGFGATLRGSGNPSVSADTLELGVTDVRSGSPALYFEGSAQTSTLFGDGVLCAGGALVRLKVRISPSTASAYPEPGEPRISVLSPVSAGTTRYYQAIYRDSGGPCGGGFNYTNGLRVVWGP